MNMTTEKLTSEPELSIVLVHGWGMNQGVFSVLAKQLSEQLPANIYCVCVDLMGHGTQANVQVDEYTLPALATQLEQQIPQNSVLVGWSLGGLVAQYLAIHKCPKVRAIVTIASTPKFQAADDWQGIAPDVLRAFEEQLEHSYARTLNRFLAIQMMGMTNAKRLLQVIKSSLDQHPQPHHQALLKGLTILQETDLRLAIGNITVPTLRLYGRLDALVPQQAIAEIQGLQKNAQSKVYEHVSHAPFISHPEWVAQDISKFVDQIINS